MSLDKKISAEPDPSIHFLPFSDGGVLYKQGSRRLLVLNQSAAVLWCLLDRASTVDELAAALSKRFAIDLETAGRDAETALELLLNEGFLGEGAAGLSESDELPELSATGPEQVEPLQWSFRKTFQTGGHFFELASQHGEVLAPFFALMDHLLVEEPVTPDTRFRVLKGAEGGWDLCLDGRILEQGILDASVLPTILMVNFACSCKAMQEKLLFHAAVIRMGGTVTLLPGRTASGKTTLAAALAARGHLYFSDELAVMDVENRMVSPFPLPMSIKPGSVEALAPLYPELPDRPEFVRPDGKKVRYIIPLGCRAGRGERTQVGRLVFPKFVQGAPTGMRELDRADALHNLAKTGSSNRPLTAGDVEAMIAVVEQAPSFELQFSNLEEAVDLLEKNL